MIVNKTLKAFCTKLFTFIHTEVYRIYLLHVPTDNFIYGQMENCPTQNMYFIELKTVFFFS